MSGWKNRDPLKMFGHSLIYFSSAKGIILKLMYPDKNTQLKDWYGITQFDLAL